MGKELTLLTLFTLFAFLASFTLLVNLSFLRTHYQHPSALCYDDHLRSSAKDSHTLSSKGCQVTSVEDTKSMGRAVMLKEVAACATVNHDVGGSDHGMSLATKASIGFMAQNKDDAVQSHHDMRWATITKMMDTIQKIVFIPCADIAQGVYSIIIQCFNI